MKIRDIKRIKNINLMKDKKILSHEERKEILSEKLLMWETWFGKFQ